MSYRDLIFNLPDVLQARAVAQATHEDLDFLLVYSLQFPPTLQRRGFPGQTVTMLRPDGTLDQAWYEAYFLSILYTDPTEAQFPGSTALNIVRYYVARRDFDPSRIQIIFSVQKDEEKAQAFARLTSRSRLVVIGHCCDKQGRLMSDLPTVAPVGPVELATELFAGAPHLFREGEPLSVRIWACQAADTFCGRFLAELYRQGILAVITCSGNVMPRLGKIPDYTQREQLIAEEACGSGRMVFYVSVMGGKPSFQVYQFP